MTKRKFTIRLACASMAAAVAVSLTGCADPSGARTTGPHPPDSYSLSKDPKDSNTVAVTISPSGNRVHAESVHPVNLHFRSLGHANDIKVEILDPKGTKTRLQITPLTTGPHPIIVSIDSGVQ